MVVPIIPIVATTAIILGVSSLVWYSRLTGEEKQEADRRANEYAWRWFETALDGLDKVRFTRILLAVKRDMTGKESDDPIGD